VFRSTIIAVFLFATAAWAQISVVRLGAHPDGTNAAATTAAFRTAFSTYPAGHIVMPAGRYLIDNSSGPVLIRNFSGQLEFQGNAQLVFTNNSLGGLLLEGGRGARISGLRATYATAPTVRASPNEEIKFSDTVDTTVTGIFVENSPAAGILFYNSVRPKVVNATVRNSLADGLHFANCEDAQVTNLTTLNTGDDGLAFLNYAQYPNKTGGTAKNIHVTNSRARGIAVVGQSNVTVTDFQIQNTGSSGVLVAQDTSYNTRIPANVIVRNGAISGAGTLLPRAGGNHYGIEYNSQTSVVFSDIVVTGAQDAGMRGQSPRGSVTVTGVTVRGLRNGVGFLFDRTQTVHASHLTVEDVPSYGFLFLKSSRVVARGLTAVHVSESDLLKRAIWFEDGGSILATGLKIVSGPGEAYVVGAYQGPGYSHSGSVTGITADITGGSLSIQNNSKRLIISR
jgi:Right handed beta helix region